MYLRQVPAALGLPTMVNNIRPQQGPRHEIPKLVRFTTIDRCSCRTPDPKHIPAIEGSSEGNRFIVESSNGNGPRSRLRCNLILDMLFHAVHWLLGWAFIFMSHSTPLGSLLQPHPKQIQTRQTKVQAQDPAESNILPVMAQSYAMVS